MIGKVPMVRAVSAFIDFFNSSGCEGITFGEMKHFLEEVLDSTLQELSNVKQLDQNSLSSEGLTVTSPVKRAEKTLFDHGLPYRLNFKSTYNKKLFLFQFCLLKDSSALGHGQGLYIWKEKTRLCRRKAYSCQPAASGVLALI